MSLRKGVTEAEEAQMRKAIAKGWPWNDPDDAENPKTVIALLEDVDAEYVHEHLYLPMLEKFEASKKSTDTKTIIEPAPAGTKKL